MKKSLPSDVTSIKAIANYHKTLDKKTQPGSSRTRKNEE